MRYLLKLDSTIDPDDTYVYDGSDYQHVRPVKGTIVLSPSSELDLIQAESVDALCERMSAVQVDLSAQHPKADAEERWEDQYG